jgi:pentatricopeptide repeat protein
MLAHAFVPDPEMCTRIHQELERTASLKPNVVTYTILLRAWAKVGNWEMVGKVYQEMRSNNIEPNKETLSVLRRWKSNPANPRDFSERELEVRAIEKSK